MSNSLNSLKGGGGGVWGGYIGDYIDDIGEYLRGYEGDIRKLDYSSCGSGLGVFVLAALFPRLEGIDEVPQEKRREMGEKLQQLG